MNRFKEQANQLIEDVTIIQPSTEWPPILLDEEVISFQGNFNKSAWLRKNVTFSALAFFSIVVLTNAIGHPIKIEGIGFVILLSFFGAAITFLMYNRQSWIITNRAVYLKKRRPMLISSVRKVVGFGATVRLIGGWGTGITLLGVENASEIRYFLQRGRS